MTSPTYRSQPAHPPSMPVVTREIDELRTKLVNKSHELDDVFDRLRVASEENASLVRFAQVYKAERDEAVEQVADLVREVECLRPDAARLPEVEAALAAVRSERDTAALRGGVR